MAREVPSSALDLGGLVTWLTVQLDAAWTGLVILLINRLRRRGLLTMFAYARCGAPGMRLPFKTGSGPTVRPLGRCNRWRTGQAAVKEDLLPRTSASSFFGSRQPSPLFPRCWCSRGPRFGFDLGRPEDGFIAH